MPAMPGLDDLDDLGELTPSAPASSTPGAGAHVSPPEAAAPAPPGDDVAIYSLNGPADDELLAAFTEVLRAFPEVEWATFSLAMRAASTRPAVGLRVIDSFRANVDSITQQLEAAAHARDSALHVLLLDDPELVRSARTLGEVFYPWRRKTRV